MKKHAAYLIVALILWLMISLAETSALWAQGALSFVARQDFEIGAFANGVISGDFDNDGIPDLAVTSLSNQISVLLGDGDGTFRPPRITILGYRPSAVAAGDFDGDQLLDLAVTNPEDNGVSVWLGRGDGTFRRTDQSYLVGQLPGSVCVGDFNGDAIADLAVGSLGSVSVLLGQGDGTFQLALNFAGLGPAITVSDFNGDGILDLAGTGAVLLGNGDGTFQAPILFTAGREPESVVAGDFNGDGLPDLAVANGGGTIGAMPSISILIGNGNGTFQPARSINVGRHPHFVTTGDFNGDGILDLAITRSRADFFVDDEVVILLGQGDGTFRPPQTAAVGFNGGTVAVGDFNGDGDQDLVVASGTVSVLLGRGDGTFRIAKSFRGGSRTTSMAVDDFNGDAVLDLVLTDYSQVVVLLGIGDGSFGPPQYVRVPGQYPGFVTVADFNRDGYADLAVTHSDLDTISILRGRGDGTFQEAVNFVTGRGPQGIAVGDFNGDDVLDLVTANGGTITAGMTVTVLLGRDDGTFPSARNFNVGMRPTSVAVADFDGDGNQDLAVANEESNSVSILLGNGDGTFQPAVHFPVGSTPRYVTVADFDGDGHPDLAVANHGSNTVSILLGQGDGTFILAGHLAVGRGPWSIAVADFDGDNVPDLAAACGGTFPDPNVIISVLRGRGDGTFAAAQNFGVAQLPQPIAAGDFNGDGRPDLAVGAYWYGGGNVLINDTPPPNR